jgi:hypothetical protein
MFEHLAAYDKIVVTGPQRSGTTIAGRMIAHDTGHTYIDENTIGVHNHLALFGVLDTRHKIVVQCPALAHTAHEVGRRGDALVVWMLRGLADIIASQERISWPEEEREKRKYKHLTRVLIAERAAQVKLRYWRDEQQVQCQHWLELNYDSLEGHPLWIPKMLRSKFADRQWTIGG